ncbi:MAG: ATP-binding cassette domain-containing protein [Bacteroidales bacterium]|nr:ATP-binding cassette domain-containing protein [Bacteroidales bacterium]
MKLADACALQDVNIEIRRRQMYGLIGRNGAGKTTLMHAVTELNPNSVIFTPSMVVIV